MTADIEKMAKSTLTAAEFRKPIKTDWGVCCIYRVPNLGGGYATSFLWFEDKAGLFSFLKNHATDLISGNHPALAKKVAQTVPADAAAIDVDDVVEKLNDILGRHVSFGWIGDFDNLTSGSSCLAIKTRKDFREDRDDYDNEETGIAPLEETEIEDFRSFVSPRS